MSAAKEVKYASPVDPEKYGNFFEDKEGVEAFREETFIFKDRIGTEQYPAEKGRYHLYLAYVCPWAQRVQLAVDYLGLQDVISYSYVDPARDARGWGFREKTGPDPINGFTFLNEAYLQSEPSFKGVPSVPLIWDKQKGRIVNDTYPDTLVDIASKFSAFSKRGIDLYPAPLQAELDRTVRKIEQGLYYYGFYALIYAEDDPAEYKRLSAGVIREFADYDKRLSARQYLAGDSITIADLAFWVLFVRLNLSFSKIFNDQPQSPLDFPNLWAYAQRLYTIPEFKNITEFDYFKESYFANNFLQEPFAYKK